MTKTALITGANSGIGRATAVQLARNGVHVILSGRDEKRGQAVVTEIEKLGGTAHFIQANLTDATSAKQLAQEALQLSDQAIDILVNNAGVFPFGATDQTDEETFDAAYNLNVKVPYFLVANLIPALSKSDSGAIVNVSSMVGSYGSDGMALYGSTKAAINQLTKAWATEFASNGIRVNSVAPGPTKTEGTVGMGDGLNQLAAQAPIGRPGTPDEIANAIVFLVSDKAEFITGAHLAVDGGRTAI